MSATGGTAPAGPPHLRLNLRGAHIHHHLRAGHGRLRHRLLMFFGIGLAAIVALGALGAVVGGPSSSPLCRPYQPCGPPRVVRPLVNLTVWRSTAYGFTFEYPGDEVTVSHQDPRGITLQLDLGNGNTGAIFVQGSSARAGSPSEAIARQIAGVPGVTQVAPDTSSADLLLGSGVGYVVGRGSVNTGYFAAPQGVGQRVALASEAATDGAVTVSVTVAGPASEAGPHSGLYGLGDLIINSVKWPTDGSGG